MLRPVGNGHGFGNLTTCVSDGETDLDSYIINLTNLKTLRNPRQPHRHNRRRLGSDRSHSRPPRRGITSLQPRQRGGIHVINKDRNPDLLKAFSIAIEAMGIIIEVTIKAEPVSYIKSTTNYEQVNILGPNLDWNATTHGLVPETNFTIIYWEETDVRVGTAYVDYARSQSVRMSPYLSTDIIGKGMKGYESDDATVITQNIKGDDIWLQLVNTYNLPANASGGFATLEYSWIPSHSTFTMQWFFQNLTITEESNLMMNRLAAWHDEGHRGVTARSELVGDAGPGADAWSGRGGGVETNFQCKWLRDRCRPFTNKRDRKIARSTAKTSRFPESRQSGPGFLFAACAPGASTGLRRKLKREDQFHGRSNTAGMLGLGPIPVNKSWGNSLWASPALHFFPGPQWLRLRKLHGTHLQLFHRGGLAAAGSAYHDIRLSEGEPRASCLSAWLRSLLSIIGAGHAGESPHVQIKVRSLSGRRITPEC
ncbi:gluconolactone oxidase [Penicillium argentinense]|uniref:Gluconolactone oxidase n=1 Tax=Penicillium argentinense TaxID=1131581 RepID=A0A9W9FN13_9EURO|nr:gluconolactone oxidase [Penicillium argentinense]KAJ5103210.1 gluconolactone oxidase [Penicillium argentinense]